MPARPRPLCYNETMVFRRRKQAADTTGSEPEGAATDDQNARIEAFWAWWTANADRFAESVRSGLIGSGSGESGSGSSGTGGLDPGLAEELRAQLTTACTLTPGWEIGVSANGKNSLCITAEGDPYRRAPVARLLAAAPASPDNWEYLSAREASPDAASFVLTGGPVDVPFADFRFGATEFQGMLDVTVYHPAFAQLDEGARNQVMFLGLDAVLGEAVTERWLGQIVQTDEPPADPVTPEDLPGVVARFADEHPEPMWVLLQGTLANGDPLLVRAMRPLRSAVYPRLDLHCQIVNSYSENNEGLPAGDERERLIEFEDQVEALSGDDCQIVTVVTGGNRQVLHVYCDSQSNARAHLEQVVQLTPFSTVTWSNDPAWEAVADYR